VKKSFYFSYVMSAFLFALILRTFIIGIYKIPSSSMEPTFLPGDFILASQISYGLHLPWSEDVWFPTKPKRGDLIIFNYKNKASTTFIKRVTAIEGDQVKQSDGKMLTVPPNEVFVLNDNPEINDDSRTQGFVSILDVEGQVKLIWFSESKESGVRWPRVLTTPVKLNAPLTE
jgi:signal peptidase I